MKAAIVIALCAVACKGGGSGSTVDGSTGSGSCAIDASSLGITWTFNGTVYSGSLLATATLQTDAVGGNSLGIMASDSNGGVLAITASPATAQSQIAQGLYSTSTTTPLATFELTSGGSTWTATGSGGSGGINITWLITTEMQAVFSATMVGSDGSGALTNGALDLMVN